MKPYSPKEANGIWFRVKLLAITGMFLATYLLYEYLTHNPYQPCAINSFINCYPTTIGKLATIFGIPVALIGLVGYITIFLSAIIKHKKLLLGMTTFGMLFCLRLTVLELIGEHVICPVCIACQLIMLILFWYGVKFVFGKKTA